MQNKSGGMQNMNGSQNGQIGSMPNGQMLNMPMNGGQSGMNPMMPPMNPPKPPKPPMNPAKKKKIIAGIILGVAGVMAAIAIVIVVVMLNKVDYGEAYRMAKEVQVDLNKFSGSRACRNVLTDLDNVYTDIAYYSEYVSECRDWGEGLEEKVTKLGDTTAVRKDAEIKAQYEKFQEGVMSMLPDREALNAKLTIAEAWHKFEVLRDDLKNTSADAEVQAAANVLIESGNEQLKVYGEGWLEKSLAQTHAYQVWDNVPYSDYQNKNALREAYTNAQKEQKEWVTANKPDIATLVDIKMADANKLNTEFNKLRSMIATRYEENYDSESGDCWEFLGEVTCD